VDATHRKMSGKGFILSAFDLVAMQAKCSAMSNVSRTA